MVVVEITVAMVQLKQSRSNKRQKPHKQYYGYLYRIEINFFIKKKKKKEKKNDNERKKTKKKKQIIQRKRFEEKQLMQC
jgi:hypothetical protein